MIDAAVGQADSESSVPCLNNPPVMFRITLQHLQALMPSVSSCILMPDMCMEEPASMAGMDMHFGAQQDYERGV